MESAPSGNPEVHKRRSSRIVQAVPLTVSGVDALGRPFQERTSTLIINCHGCRYQSKHYVLKNMWITLEVPNPEPGSGPRTARARVMWIQRPRTVRELFQVGVELEVPGNIWGIAFPPPDWFPVPEAARVEVSPAEPEPPRELPHPAAEPRQEWIAPPEPASEKIHAPVPVEDNVRTMPVAEAAPPSLALAREMTRLVHEAKQQLQAVVRETAAEAVSTEIRPLMASLQHQVQEAAERSVNAAAGNAAEQALRNGLAQAAQANEAQLEALREQWDRQIHESIERAGSRVSERLAEIAHERAAAFENQLHTRYHLALDKAEQSAGDFSSRLEKAQERLQQLEKQAGDMTAASSQDIEQRLREKIEQVRGQLAELDQVSRQLDEKVSTSAAAAQSAWQARLDADLEAAAGRWNQQMQTSIESAAQQTAERLAKNSQQTTQQFEQELSARINAIGTAFAEAQKQAENDLQALRDSLAGENARAQDSVRQVQAAAQQAGEWPAKINAMARTAEQELEKRAAALLEAESRQLTLRAEDQLAGWTSRLEPALEAAARQTVARMGTELEQQFTARLERATDAFGELERGALSAQATLRSHQQTLAKVSEQEIENALSRLQESIARLEQDFGESGRAATVKWLGELDTRATDTTHTTFEALFKTAEWYEKKVHTQMQAAIDKGIEQAGGNLREKAGELSSLFATELDHYSRSYVEHTQDQVDEAAREALERISKQSAEMAATAAASISQQAHNQTEASLEELRSRSDAALDQLAVQMGERAGEVQKSLEAESQTLAGEFRTALSRQVEQSMGEAKEELFSQVALSKDDVRNTGEELEKQLRQTITSLSDSAAEEYRKRLESASDSWLAATTEKLNRQSLEHIEKITEATEERLRETCNQVFNGVGETLRRRMLDLFGSAGQTPSSESK